MAVRVLVFPTDFRRFSTTAAASGSEIAPAHAPRHLSKPVALPPRPPSAPSASHRCRGGAPPPPLTRAGGFHGLAPRAGWDKTRNKGVNRPPRKGKGKRRPGRAAGTPPGGRRGGGGP